jgi:hypothetical protein
MSMKSEPILKVYSAVNGYVIETGGEDADLTVVHSSGDDVEGVSSLLYYIIEALGHYGSKDDKRRVVVACLPGDSYSGELDDAYRQEITELRDRCNDALGVDL